LRIPTIAAIDSGFFRTFGAGRACTSERER
jgi:hypothetical protein